jgi:hypothetical protein
VPYEIKASGVGAWQQGQIIEDQEWEAYPHREKALAKGYAVKADANDARALKPDEQAAQVAELDAQIAQLQAQRSALLGTTPEPTAPAQVTYTIDRANPPSVDEADATRAAGKEVVQPLPGAPARGSVEPGEAAEGAKSTKRK